MTPKKSPQDAARALLENQKAAFNAKAAPIPRALRFQELEFFQPYQRHAILKESGHYAIRQPRFIYATLAVLALWCVGACVVWFIQPKSAVFLWPSFALACLPSYYLKKRFMVDYIRMKIKSKGQ